jgi:ribosomal protein L37AE/L43A
MFSQYQCACLRVSFFLLSFHNPFHHLLLLLLLLLHLLFPAGARDSTGAQDPIESRTNLCQIKEDGMGMSEKGDYATVRGAVSFIKHDNEPWYPACTTPNCNKKVIRAGAGDSWMCEKCSKSMDEVSIAVKCITGFDFTVAVFQLSFLYLFIVVPISLHREYVDD